MSDKPRVLCVDDEPRILSSIQRSLRGRYDIETAGSGREALDLLARAADPFQVVISDMKMPHMNGSQFLHAVQARWPETVRILLTGYADMGNVVDAVNEGYIFRFLAKPCSARLLDQAIAAAVHQHQLQTAEKVLLEQTVQGSIRALTDILALSSPTLFGRANRIRQLASAIAREAAYEDTWRLDVAASLSQIGCISLPDHTAARLFNGEELSENEIAMIERMPRITQDIVAHIPRLEPVLEILAYETKNFDGSGSPQDKLKGEDIPLGARILKVASRCEELQARNYTPSRVYDTLRLQAGVFDPKLVEIYSRVAAECSAGQGPRGIGIHELRIGMVFSEPVRSAAGLLLVSPGQEVTEGLLARLQNYHDTTGLAMPLWISRTEGEIPEDEAATAEAEPPVEDAGDRPTLPADFLAPSR
jgi:response regulator RpfG family c-di-GMP phosphodiesterase